MQRGVSNRPESQAPSARSKTTHARWPLAPQGVGLMQVPEALMLNGFASPPQKQSPLQPGISARPDWQKAASPRQQARWFSPPQGAARLQWLFAWIAKGFPSPPQRKFTSPPE